MSKDPSYSWRVQAPVYGVGVFATAIYYTSMVVVPLQATLLGATPLMLGIIFAARHFLPLLLGIHAGALMDRLGAGRVVAAVALIGMAVPLLYPVAPWVGLLIACQLFAGLTDILGWMGAQTMVGTHLGGRTKYSGRLMAVGKIGPLVGPLLAGAAWDRLGAWGAFGALALMALGMLLSVLMLPRHRPVKIGTDNTGAATPDRRRPITLHALLPDPRDYGNALRLLGKPAIALIVLMGASYHLVNAIQGTFYLRWLTDIGISATEMGALVSAGAATAALGSLLTARLCRFIPGPWLLIFGSWAAVVFICLTPLFAGLTLLGAFMMLRTGALGVSQPLTVSLLMKTVEPTERGLSVGLRGTVNRVASIAAPVLMGLIAEIFGLEMSFYIVGGTLSLAFAAMILHYRKHPEALPPLWTRRTGQPRRRWRPRRAAPLPGLVRFGGAPAPDNV